MRKQGVALYRHWIPEVKLQGFWSGTGVQIIVVLCSAPDKAQGSAAVLFTQVQVPGNSRNTVHSGSRDQPTHCSLRVQGSADALFIQGPGISRCTVHSGSRDQPMHCSLRVQGSAQPHPT